MRDYSGLNDKSDAPIYLGDSVFYNGHVYKVFKNKKGKIQFESTLGLGDLEILHKEVLVIGNNSMII